MMLLRRIALRGHASCGVLVCTRAARGLASGGGITRQGQGGIKR